MTYENRQQFIIQISQTALLSVHLKIFKQKMLKKRKTNKNRLILICCDLINFDSFK